MKLYHNTTSPFVRKAWIVLEMTGLIERTELVRASGTPLTPDRTAVGVNPLGKVPALETDDGRILYDSRVITRYLDQVGEGGLYPEGEALFTVLTLEATADGILDAAILMLYESRLRPGELRFAPWVEAQESKILRAAAALDAVVADHLDGATTAAHVAVGAALGYLDFRFRDIGWRSTAPELDAWYDSFQEHDFMRATRPSD